MKVRTCKLLLHTLRVRGLQFSGWRTTMVLRDLQAFEARLSGEYRETAPYLSIDCRLYIAGSGLDLPNQPGAAVLTTAIPNKHRIFCATRYSAAPRSLACRCATSASFFNSSRICDVSMVGQPIMCCSAISANAAIHVGDSFRQGI